MEISRESRLNIIQTMKHENVDWYGDLDDVKFLSRIYDLESIESFDDRYDSAKRDIMTHRISFPDWLDDWVFEDSRFNLMSCADQKFLKFLCETIHPVVRSDHTECENLLKLYNKEIRSAGFEIVESETMFGNVAYYSRELLQDVVKSLHELETIDYLDADNVKKQISRMQRNIYEDPALAIGTAKEFVETVSKTILTKLGCEIGNNEDLHKLVRQIIEKLEPLKTPESKTSNTIKKIGGALTALVNGISELRNREGTGHGKAANSSMTETAYAKLAVYSASTLGLFLTDIYRQYSQGRDHNSA